MEDLKMNVEQNISLKDDSKVSDFINAESRDSSDSLVNTNINTMNNEKNSENEHPLPVSEAESEENTYQDILGSGDLTKKIIKQGTLDERPTRGEQIVINLVGHLEDKDNIIEEEKYLEITLGDCEVKPLKYKYSY